METISENDLRDLLDREAARINNPEFALGDPVQFPRRFERQEDVEIASLLCSSIAWGNRKMICANCEKMLALMDNQPYAYMMDRGYEELPDMNIHRTFFARDLRAFLRGLRAVYSRHENLDAFAASIRAGESETPSWALVEALNAILREENRDHPEANLSRCLPQNLATTALKRVNMALRWLVRDDGIVDLGLWRSIKPSQLYIPLDVHVGDTARELGLLTRRADDRRSTVELTAALRRFNPADPVLYDYALFGIGMGL
ncbi:MAG: TIGR02757 family protein [[Clostridium] fimetarium]|nr:TIGR02757 family protein [Alistipes timonensis]MCM1405969.1 TIGR02757 family protein [[Clostridium] fimetarium]